MSAVLGLAHQADRRKTRRQPVSIEAKITSDAIWCEVDCTIQNRSPRGCRLHLPMEISLPRQFFLTIPSEGDARPVRLIWHRGPALGVEFL